jgi:hypothetical protein
MIPVTAETIRATYEWLSHFPPFCRWHLPPAKKITFYVTDFVSEVAEYDHIKKTLRVSTANVGTYDMLIRVMAHELIHVREHVSGKWTVKHDSAFFRQSRAMICKHFAFDPLTF